MHAKTAKTDQLQASFAKLTTDVGVLSKAVAGLDPAMSTATKLRAEDKAKNAEAVSDAQEAQTAVTQALAVLAKHTADNCVLSKAVAELDAARSAATKLRADEKATHAKGISDSQEAKTAVTQALTVLAVSRWSQVETDRMVPVYFAKLAEKVERYDVMADHMEAVGKASEELSVEER